ncbi:redoxin domain-containing protein [Nonomuraea sp. NPDC046570]|uniref:TlpA family protein disulfide reductase n=1 Tax=Nonomuraea sp. NPDC046570 TaxID=3155255 RepID=UPI0033C2656C
MNTTTQALLGVVGLLVCLNLLFTYGVVRRLKEHEKRFADLGPSDVLPPAAPAIGSEIPDFHAVTVDGREVSRTVLGSGEAYVGFFTTSCAPCRERLPEFARFAADRQNAQVLAVIAGEPDKAREMAEAFDGRVLTVVEEGPPVLSATFEVDRYPTILALRDGTVEVNAGIMAHLTMSPTA